MDTLSRFGFAAARLRHAERDGYIASADRQGWFAARPLIPSPAADEYMERRELIGRAGVARANNS
jgi:hypothetical protein